MNNFKYMLIFLLMFSAFSLKSERFLLPASKQHRPVMIVGSLNGVQRGTYNIPLKLERANLDDVQISYWILVGSQSNVKRVSIQPDLKAPKQSEQMDLVPFLLKNIILNNEPIQIQYVMEFKHLDNETKVFASNIIVVLRPKNFQCAHFWQSRPNALDAQIDEAWDCLNKPKTGFASAKDGFPCNGKASYDIGDISTDQIIVEELSCKDTSTFRILELGTANGAFLSSAHQDFGLSFDQLVGISALDHRSKLSSVPDSSYILHNIERLNLIFEDIKPVDLVISRMTWLYLCDPLSALAMTYELLKDSGIMYIEVQACWLKQQGVDIEELADGLRALGLQASVIWGGLFHVHNKAEREVWFVIRKTALKPVLEFPYKIIGLTPPEREFALPRALYEPTKIMENHLSTDPSTKKRKLITENK